MMEDVLFQANVGYSFGLRPHRLGLFPSQCGSSVLESVASKSCYSLPSYTVVGEQSFSDVGSVGFVYVLGKFGSYRPPIIPDTGTVVNQTETLNIQ